MCSCFSQVQRFVVGKSTVQEIRCHAMFLVGFRTFGDKIARFFIHQDLLKKGIPIIFLILIERI